MTVVCVVVKPNSGQNLRSMTITPVVPPTVNEVLYVSFFIHFNSFVYVCVACANVPTPGCPLLGWICIGLSTCLRPRPRVYRAVLCDNRRSHTGVYRVSFTIEFEC